MSEFVISKGAAEEILVINDLAIQVSISKLIDFVNDNISDITISEYPTKELMKLKRTDIPNRYHLSNIDKERIEEPIMAAVINDEEWVIDGNHRLIKRAENNMLNTRIVVIPQDIITNYIQPFSLRI